MLTNRLSTTENFWTPLVSRLAPESRVVHWSYRGHGESDGGALLRSANDTDWTESRSSTGSVGRVISIPACP